MGALVRGAPALLRNDAESALRVATQTRDEFEAFKAGVVTILGTVQEEREATVRAAARASAAKSRAAQLGGDNGAQEPETREQLLARVRRESGLLG